MSYRFLEHMTDAYIEVQGDTLEQAFEFAAKALVDTMVNVNSVAPVEEEQIVAEGHDLESLLYNWLEAVMLKLIVDKKALSDFEVFISKHDDKYQLKATVKGEQFDVEKHQYKIEIKGVTYHMMKIEQNKTVKMRFLLDL
ncbi:MAG TPA: archease [Nitrososphaerales archaeon]|nr:archease [Nitrososphaerales archaeon]